MSTPLELACALHRAEVRRRAEEVRRRALAWSIAARVALLPVEDLETVDRKLVEVERERAWRDEALHARGGS